MAKKRRFIAISVIALSILVASPALASTKAGNKASYSATYFFGRNKTGHAYSKPSVIGKVSGINGDSLTVTDKNGVAYSVNASHSEIKEGFNKTGTLADIKVGDTVLVQGSLSGSTTIAAATSITDRSLSMAVANTNNKRITGTISSISGSTLSVLTASSTSYTVDISSAKIVLGGGARHGSMITGSASSLQVNDKVMVSGTTDPANSELLKARMLRDITRS